MKYHVQHCGQPYGPYDLDELRSYLDQHRILGSDAARADSSSSWMPVDEVLRSPLAAEPPRYLVHRQGRVRGPYSMDQIRTYLAQGTLVLSDLVQEAGRERRMRLDELLTGAPPSPALPPPPSLHWAIVLLPAWVTCGLFYVVWMFVQSFWARRIDPRSRATRYYAVSLALAVVSGCVSVPYLFAQAIVGDSPIAAVAFGFLIWLVVISVLGIVGTIFLVAGFFDISRSMELYYNTKEPIGLRLGGVMVFFCNVFFLQHHFTRIADWKRTGVLSA